MAIKFSRKRRINLKLYNKGVTHEFFGMGAVVGNAKDAEGVVVRLYLTRPAKKYFH